MIGSLPKKLKVFAKTAQEVTTEWDDITYTPISKETVCPAFITDAENLKTHETAERWAKESRYGSPASKYTVLDIDNTPVFTQDSRIVGMEKRSEGGRAYKVIIKFQGVQYYVDLREDVLLDLILNTGIKKNGILPCDLIWGRVGSQMKLVRVNSDLHKELIKANLVGAMKKISNSELEIGGVYENKKGDKFLFLGYVSYLNMETEYVQGNYGQANYNRFLGVKRIDKIQAWYEIPAYDWEDTSPNKPWGKEFHYFAFRNPKSLTVKMKVAQYNVNDSWIDALAKNAEKSLNDSYLRYCKAGTLTDEYLFGYSKYFNIAKFGDILKLHPLYQGRATFSNLGY